MAANAITSVTQQMSTVLIQGVCQAGAIVTGQTLGEGDREKAQKQAGGFLYLGIGLGLLSAVFIMAVSGPIISSYNVSEETAGGGGGRLLTGKYTRMFWRSDPISDRHRSKTPTSAARIPPKVPTVSIIPIEKYYRRTSIYVCLKSDQIAKTFWCIFRLRGGKWIKKIRV